MGHWRDNEEEKRPVYERVIKQLLTYVNPILCCLADRDLRDVLLFLPYCSEVHIWERDLANCYSMREAINKLPPDQQKKIKLNYNYIEHCWRTSYDVMFLDTNWCKTRFLGFIGSLFDHNHKERFSVISEVVSRNTDQANQFNVIDRVQVSANMHKWRVPEANPITTYRVVNSQGDYRGGIRMVCSEFVFTKQ